MSTLPSIEQLRKLSAEGLSPEGYGGGYVKIRPEELDALLDVVEAAQLVADGEGFSIYDHSQTLVDALARFTREEN